jgi:hypothetical protein
LKGAALGAGALFLFDPQRGAARRSKLRRELLEMGVGLGDEADRAVVATGCALANQAKQAAHWLLGSARSETPANLRASALDEEHLSSPWRSQSRLFSGTVGSLLLVYGITRRRPLARLAMTAGLGLIAEGLLHHSISEGRPAESRRENTRQGEEPGVTSPARGQADEAANPSWKVAVP